MFCSRVGDQSSEPIKSFLRAWIQVSVHVIKFTFSFSFFFSFKVTTGGGLIKYTVLIKYTGVIKYTVRKPILSVEICEIKYTVFVYIFLTKKFFQQVLHKKSKKNFFDFGGPDSVRAVMGSLCAEKRVFLT